MKTSTNRASGLSLVELAVVLATAALVVGVVLPRIFRPRVFRCGVSCTSNLKQVGIAYRLYSGDHNDQFPFAVSNELGGSLSFVSSPQVFRHYEIMSNELVT